MAKNLLVSNMIEKYLEVYDRAGKEAHDVVAKFFADGFKAVA